MTESTDRAQTVFLNALEITSDEVREAYVDAECRGNEALRREVCGLLEHAQRLGGFLENDNPPVSAFDPTIESICTDRIGTRIGPYKIRETLAEGGMGVVYVAEQTEPVRRKVALKIIKRGMATKDVVARFEAERQALAVMEHPNIAQVFDGGATDAGYPFFVMELIQGSPITEYCDQRRLSNRERLQLFLQVCRAVQHAHQKGIIHRDIKPTNVLVAQIDGAAVPKVIDFGVAKAVSQKLTDQTVYTKFSQLIGTPLYMSPEQVEMGVVDIDTRSDVYSLGVLLYELLTGSTPFDRETLRNAAFDELRRIIREEEPRRPSAAVSTLQAQALSTVATHRQTDPRKLCDGLKGELDWLVMKALEKDRNRRYESASDFATDVQRYLDNEPVAACPPSVIYRFRKFARRNKAAMVTAAVLTVSLVLGLCGTTWQAIRARQAEKEATRAEAAATAGFRMARGAVDRLMTRVAEEHLLNTPKMEQMRELLLKDALEFYQQMAKLQGNDPSVRLDKALAESRLGNIHGQLNNRDAAEDALRNAIDQLRELHQEFPQRQQYTAALADALHHYGNALFDTSYRDGTTNNEELALEAHDEAIALLEDLVKRYPKVAQHKLILVETYLQRSRVLAMTKMGTIQQGLRHLRRAELLAAELVRLDGDNAKFKFAYANALAARGRLFDTESEEVREAMNESVKLLQELVDDFPEISEYRKQLANTLASMVHRFPPEQPADALKQRKRVLELYEQLAEGFPSIAEYRAELSMARRHFGSALQRNGDLQAAEEQYRIAETILLKLREEYPEFADYKNRLSWVYTSLVDIFYSQRQYGAATQAATKLVELFPDAGRGYSLRGTMFLCMGDYEQSLADVTRAVNLNPNDVTSNATMAWMLVAGPSDMRNPEKAVVLVESRLVALESEISAILGAAYYRLGQYARASEKLASAVQNEDDGRWFHFGHSLFGESLFFLAMTCGQLERPEEAQKWFAQAETWIKENAGPEDVHLQTIRKEAAALLTGTERQIPLTNESNSTGKKP